MPWVVWQGRWAPTEPRRHSTENPVSFWGPLPSLVFGLLLNGVILGARKCGQATHGGGKTATLGVQRHHPTLGSYKPGTALGIVQWFPNSLGALELG